MTLLSSEYHDNIDSVASSKRQKLMYSLWLLIIVIVAAFAVISFFDGRRELSVALSGCTLIAVIFMSYLHFSGGDRLSMLIPNLFLCALCLILIFTGGKENTGPLFIYPIVTCMVLINGFRQGARLGLAIAVALIASLFLAEHIEFTARYDYWQSSRFVMSLLALMATALVGSYLQEKAQGKMHNLHQDVHELAYYDSLTGLANRSSFRSWLQRMLDRKRSEGGGLAVIYIDLDDFKQINDRCGHQVGDRLLVEFGRRLAECVRPTDGSMRVAREEDVARLAGDEFIVTLPDVDAPYQAEVVAKRILAMFEGGFEVDGLQLPVTASVGIAYLEDQFQSAETLLNWADAAMYRAKESGKNTYQFFSEAIARDIQERNCIEAGLQDALARDDFKLLYMPIYESQSLEVVGYEVLLRCESPIIPGVGPDRFIPVAEATGLIKPIDLWVLDHAMAALRELQAQGFEGLMCVNISAVELHNALFPDQVAALLHKYELNADRIELEVTETSLVLSDHASQATLEKLRALGVGLSLDDFGTGYTAFTQLMNYPVNCLKIDRSYVGALFSENQAHCKMVDVIQNLGALYNLRVIAEGVETEKQLVYLRQIGCDWLQGYYLSKPVEFSTFLALVTGPEKPPCAKIERLREAVVAPGV